MDLFTTIETRQSIRAYAPQPVEAEKLEAILKAANQAPSAGNLQPYEIYVVKGEATRRQLVKACMDHRFLEQSPVVLIFCVAPERNTKYGKLGEELFAVQDSAVAVAYAQLAATALGLATCWIGAMDAEQIKNIVGLKPGHRPVAVLPIGYAAETPPRTTRRPLGEMVVETGL